MKPKGTQAYEDFETKCDQALEEYQSKCVQALKDYENDREQAWKEYESKRNQAFDDQQETIEVWESEFPHSNDKTNFILSLDDDFAGLSEKKRETIEDRIKLLVESGADFADIYAEYELLLLDCSPLARNVKLEIDNEI